MSEFECSVSELNNDKKISKAPSNQIVNSNVVNTNEKREENNVIPPQETNNVNISFLDKLKDENSVKTILLIIIGYIITTSSLFKDIVEIWLPSIMEESEISLLGKVVIAALIGLSVIWFTFSYQVR